MATMSRILVPESSERVYQALRDERENQDSKWGEQNHDDYRWLAILTEEIGEVSQAALHDEFGGKHAGTIKTELIQLAAVAIAWLECIERRGHDTSIG